MLKKKLTSYALLAIFTFVLINGIIPKNPYQTEQEITIRAYATHKQEKEHHDGEGHHDEGLSHLLGRLLEIDFQFGDLEPKDFQKTVNVSLNDIFSDGNSDNKNELPLTSRLIKPKHDEFKLSCFLINSISPRGPPIA
jgi:hypothetical protein